MGIRKKDLNLILWPLGIFLLILGVSLILRWWTELVVFFRATLGIVLAITGLFLMYMAGNKR